MEDTGFENQRIVRRRLMEGGGGGEVRRVHILYFLNRNGIDEHPHLIRIHYLSKNGVRLKDIKRWLGKLRGKGMPDSFAWSYKRRYKTGYVWHDLVDDDLVTPLSDNEYVLKGSQISSTTYIEEATHSSDDSTHIITPSEIEDSSPTSGSKSSTSVDVSANDEQEHNSEIVNQESSHKPRCKKRHIFRNLLTCGGVDTNDSMVVMTKKRSKSFLNMCSSCSSIGVKNSGQFRETCASFKPLYGPNCSQCGKRFKPEKLYAHMKSCIGMKAKGKDCDISAISTANRNEDSVSGYILAR